MVIDTSAIVAILFGEADRRIYEEAIETAPLRLISAVTRVELSFVVEGRERAAGRQRLDRFFRLTGAQVVAVTPQHAEIAIDAFRRFHTDIRSALPARSDQGPASFARIGRLQTHYGLAASSGETWRVGADAVLEGFDLLSAMLPSPQQGTRDMAYDAPPPEHRPEPGFYYHFKHDPNGPINNYAYYIYGVGHHTEDDCRPEDAFMQVYRPLYEEAYACRHGGLFDLRPLEMFYTPAQWQGREVPRFTRIRDPDVIAELAAIKARLYSGA